MDDKQSLEKKLIELLSGIDFANRYYNFHQAHRDRGNVSPLGRTDFDAALAASPFNFTYNAREKFFIHEQRHEHCTIGLRIAFTISTAEMILSIKSRQGYLGGPFALLARQVAQMSNPSFSYSPAYPKLPFSDAASLQSAVQFGISLFQDAKQAIASYTGWDA